LFDESEYTYSSRTERGEFAFVKVAGNLDLIAQIIVSIILPFVFNFIN